MRHSFLFVVFSCVWLLAAKDIFAKEQSGYKQDSRLHGVNASPYDVDLGLDLGLTIGAITILGLPDIIGHEIIRPWCGLDCDKNDINSMDRRVVGNTSKFADVFSDVGLGVSDALPFVLGTLDVLISHPPDAWSGWAKDTMVLAETLSLTLASTNLIKYVVRRPRPFVYSDQVDDQIRLAPDSSLSFPSGHTSSSFAMATAYSFTFMHRHPNTPLVIPVWIGTLGLAAAVGVARTQAGEHFYTDVIAGAVLGAGMGLLVPYLHLREANSSEKQGDNGNTADNGPKLTLLPLITSSGGGLVVSFH